MYDNTDLISIIVPVYNTKQYLDECIRSIQSQSYKNLEIILVNDGSTDESGDICDFYAHKDSRIRVIHKKNGGLSDARNAGIDLAAGEYLAFVDADDYIQCDYIEKLVLAVKNTNAEIVCCGFQKVNEQSELLEKINFDCNTQLSRIEAFSFLNEKDDARATILIAAWGKLYHKKLFTEIRYPVGRWHEDEFIVHYLIGQVDKVVVISDAGYYYRQHSESFMAIVDRKHMTGHISRLIALSERVMFYEKNCPELVSDAMHHYLQESCSLYDIISDHPDWNMKQDRNKIVSDFKKCFIRKKHLLTKSERILCGMFSYVPLLYVVMSKLKRVFSK